MEPSHSRVFFNVANWFSPVVFDTGRIHRLFKHALLKFKIGCLCPAFAWDYRKTAAKNKPQK